MRLLATSGDRLDQVRAAYEEAAAEYLTTTPAVVTGAMQEWIDRTISALPSHALVLEVGSGSGRDADYIEAAGLRVIRTDVVAAFLEGLRAKGHEAAYLDAVRDDFPVHLDCVFANAVVCHFEKPQFSQFLMRSRLALKPGGILSFTTKLGDRYESTTQQSRLAATRKFSRWPTNELIQFLNDHDFTVNWHSVSGGIRSTSKWVNVIARKRPAIFED